MKCPNCGSLLEEGNLVCEVCGEEINIVPEYDPDVDLSVDIDGVFDHTKEIDVVEVKKQKKPPKSRSEYYEKNKHVSREQVIDSVEDWDEEDPNEVGAIKDLILSVVDFWNRNIFTKI
ncbi:MAG: zinc ribbon domain-containing protein, partial [Lachnospiraceae bacterium]|nr:zinc ribbon domain-containing protein [Lachnospiraceae bacterium]